MDIHHNGTKRYQCKHCNKQFKRKSCLLIHTETHQSRLNRNTFKCHICGISFTFKTNMTRHIKNKH